MFRIDSSVSSGFLPYGVRSSSPAAGAYRPDIDGMRAIAVVAVVLGHARIPGFGGGFLGVDIFFVLSGFLITGILFREAQSGGISLARFYERRVRRIVPALGVVLLASTLAAFVLFSPYELKQYASSLLASAGFVANLFFMAGTDYFSPRYETPLLHLWSLGVEEQFYIFFPLFLSWFLARRPIRLLVPALTFLLLLSLALSEFSVRTLPSAAGFYFTGSRAWELLLGAVVALAPSPALTPILDPKRLGAVGRELMALIALLLMTVPIFLFDPNTPWPGLHAVPPCTGTAILLALHRQDRTLVSRLLSTKPFVGIGLISYSLYLWHWPLFEFWRRWVLRTPTVTEYACLIGIAIGAAWFSWRYVERPFRRPEGRFDRRFMFRGAGLAGGLCLLLAVAVYAGSGFPSRFPPEVRQVYAALDGGQTPQLAGLGNLPKCYVRNHAPPYDFARCFRVAPDRLNIVVWGDSFVGNSYYGLYEEGRRVGVKVIEASHFDCRPVLDSRLVTRACAAFNRSILDHLNSRNMAVVLSARFFNHQELVPDLIRTARQIAGKGIPVFVVGASLEYREAGPFYVARYVETHDPRWIDSRCALKPGLRAFDRQLRAAFEGMPGVTYLSVLDSVCIDGRCPMIVDGHPVQVDFGHLSIRGSLLFGKRLWPAVEKGLARIKPPAHDGLALRTKCHTIDND